jgi:glycerophosphoryl diester phosphodiesterase
MAKLTSLVILASGLIAIPHQTKATIEVHGHRGARARYPENTLPAFQYALQVGVDYLEMDLNVTRDNVLIINHDPDLTPDHCLSPFGNHLIAPVHIRDMLASELKLYDCGALKNADFPNQTPVPGTHLSTFNEFLDWLKASPLPQAAHVQLNVEAKIEKDSPKPAVFAKMIIDALRAHDMIDRTVLESFDYDTLKEAKKIEPTLRTSALTNSWWRSSVSIARESGADIVSPYYLFISENTVNRLHDMNVKALPWTPDTEKDWAHLIDKGVDGIITDDPEALIKYLKQEGLRP